jgi:hypothetical protein
VPHGLEREQGSFWKCSSFWGVVFEVGDAAFFFSTIGLVLFPLVFIGLYCASLVSGEPTWPTGFLGLVGFVAAACSANLLVSFAGSALRNLAMGKTGVKMPWDLRPERFIDSPPQFPNRGS